MIKIQNFDNCPVTDKSYGGHSGSKMGILINNENYLLKFPKSTRSMNVSQISYTTSPLSEYLGSHIYESVGIDTHKTILGILDNKLVVACKDFLGNTEEIIDYNAIKNKYEENIEKYLEERHSSTFDKNDDLNEIIFLMENNPYFKKVPELKIRFWDMFVIDALISNNDRNEANWGLIYNKETGSLRCAPVYDNGASFYNKNSSEKFLELLNDNDKFIQTAYDSAISIFKIDDKIINPLKYIENQNNKDCNEAVKRIFPKINKQNIKDIFNALPNYQDDILIISEEQKELYYKILEYRIDNILQKVYNNIMKKEDN